MKVGKEAYIEPIVDGGTYHFVVRTGIPPHLEATKSGTKLARANFRCLMSGSPISGTHIKAEGKAGRIGTRMMAIVAEGNRGRVYLSPTAEIEAVAKKAKPEWKPEGTLVDDARAFTPTLYGFSKWSDLFTPRQLVAMTILSGLVNEAREWVKSDAVSAGIPDDASTLVNGGSGAAAYSDAVAVYLAIALSKATDSNNSFCPWEPVAQCPRQIFGRQAIPILWDFAEANPLHGSSGGFSTNIDVSLRSFVCFPSGGSYGHSTQDDASLQEITANKILSTDPPYFDNVPYADLSDFFYVWLRLSLRQVYPGLFSTLAVPKDAELVASPYRHGGKEKAEEFFLDGMTRAMRRLSEQTHPAFPVTIYYAFKQSETESDGTASTGWETFLGSVIQAGFVLSGTWPMRTEQTTALKTTRNALASCIVLVCRKRLPSAPVATRRDFLHALKAELPVALKQLQRGNIAPVDFAQAAIGPGMGVYTRYNRVLDTTGKPVSVREALALINETFDEVLTEQEGDFDADSRWALSWFDQFGFAEGDYGVAETLSTAKNTSVTGLVDAGILASGHSKARLLKPIELPADWEPAMDHRLTHWEMVHHLVRVLESGGEGAAAVLVKKLGSKAETARELCYRLYTLCERKKRAAEAMSYNGLVQSWPEITRLALEGGAPRKKQTELFGSDDEEA